MVLLRGQVTNAAWSWEVFLMNVQRAVWCIRVRTQRDPVLLKYLMIHSFEGKKSCFPGLENDASYREHKSWGEMVRETEEGLFLPLS